MSESENNSTGFDPERLAAFPNGPGVYLMKDGRGGVLYVGKAANLRSRVRSYFHATDNRFSVQYLMRRVTDVEYILTANEKEAFLLENTLIKKHRPRFNIQLRDDKTYLSLRFDTSVEWPRLQTARGRRAGDKAEYYGPYASAGAVRSTLRLIHQLFPLRSCSDAVLKNRTRPCILHQIDRCCAPCVGKVTSEDYSQLVRGVDQFLRGNTQEVESLLTRRMEQHSERMEFEKAALLRDRLRSLQTSMERQRVASHAGFDRDVIAYYAEQGEALVLVATIRGGVLTETRPFNVKDYSLPPEEVLYGFISQFYDEGRIVAPEILVSVDPSDRELLQQWLRDLRKGAVELHCPQRGEKRHFLELMEQNAREQLNAKLQSRDRAEFALGEIQKKIGLSSPPRVIECFDISNFQGVLGVGSMVCFEDGEPKKSAYRRYKIRTVEGANDFAMLREVLARRFRRALDERQQLPDFVVVDGGKGQLQQAVEIFQELKLPKIPLAGIAKSRLKPMKSRSAQKYRTTERIFIPGRKNPIVFPYNSPGLFLLQRVRDEAHRFAITFHKKLRRMKNLRSALEEIPGVGKIRKRRLLGHFGSLSRVREASLEDLLALEGLGSPAAKAVHDFFHGVGELPAETPLESEDSDDLRGAIAGEDDEAFEDDVTEEVIEELGPS